MKLFQHSQGFIVAFGFDMMKRVPAPRMISWCDPTTQEWETKPTNSAGYNLMGFPVAPDFIFEDDGKIIAYQPGRCIEMQLIGGPLIWSFTTLIADKSRQALAA